VWTYVAGLAVGIADPVEEVVVEPAAALESSVTAMGDWSHYCCGRTDLGIGRTSLRGRCQCIGVGVGARAAIQPGRSHRRGGARSSQMQCYP
jgi:hypothetical protein